MSFIRVSWPSLPHVAIDDVVEDVAAAGFPVQGRAGRIFVLHADGQVTQHGTTRDASAALGARAEGELLLWLLEDVAVAATVRRVEARVECVLSLSGAPPAEQEAARRAVAAVLDGRSDVLVDVVVGPSTTNEDR